MAEWSLFIALLLHICFQKSSFLLCKTNTKQNSSVFIKHGYSLNKGSVSGRYYCMGVEGGKLFE